MATGEVGFTSEGRTAKRMTFEPIPTDDYKLKLDFSKAEVQTYRNNPVPYIGMVRLEAMETGTKGGKNKFLLHNLYTGIDANEHDNTRWDNQAGPQGLLDALAATFSAPASAIKTFPEVDDKGEETGGVVKIVDPLLFLKFLKQYQSSIVNGHVVVRQKKGEEPKNRLAYFIAKDVRNEATGDDGNGQTWSGDATWAPPESTGATTEPGDEDMTARPAQRNGAKAKQAVQRVAQ